MTATQLPVLGLFNALSSKLASIGLFERTTTHEPKSAPGPGIYAAVLLDTIDAYREGSGLNITSSRVSFILRIVTNMLQEPQDSIDPDLLDAVDAVYAMLNTNFTLDVTGVRNVDLMSVSTRTGYIDQDGKKYRLADITVPILVNDVWDQSE